MNVALVFPGCHRRGGVERLVWECARHLAKRHRVTVVASEWEECADSNIAYNAIPDSKGPSFMRPIRFARRVESALKEIRPDVTVSFGAEGSTGGVLWVNSVHRAWLERSGGMRGGLRSHSLRRYLLPHHQAILALEARHFRQGGSRTIITASDRVADDLHGLYGVPCGSMRTIPNGFSPDEFSPERRIALRERMRSELCLPRDAVVLLMVANELRRKGFALLLEAVAQVGDPRLHILLAGRMPPAPFHARIDALRLGNRVRYVGIAEDVARFHAAADLFVLPTQYEASCLAIVEALASGLPVITTDVPGAGDLIRPGVNGLLQQDPLSAAELAGCLARGLEADRRQAWSMAAPATVQSYRWPLLLERFEAVLETSCRS